MTKKRFWSRLKPRMPEEETPSKNVRKAAGAVDTLARWLKWLVSDD